MAVETAPGDLASTRPDAPAGIVGERRAALREAILAVAERRVSAMGLAALGIREIAAEAGCAVGMVYKLFSDHDELVLCVNARTLVALGEAVAAAVSGAPDPRDAMCCMAEGYLDYAMANTSRWDALFSHRMASGAQLPDWYVALLDDLFRRVAAVLGEAAQGVSGQDGFARTLFSAVHGVVALGLGRKVTDMSPEMLRAELRTLVGVVADGLSVRSAVE